MTTPNEHLDANQVALQHQFSDLDSSTQAQHHSLGIGPSQATSGTHTHDGTNSRKIPVANIVGAARTISGSRGGNAALASLLTALAAEGLIVDATTA